MKVKDLIKHLKKLPQECDVVYSIDDEGNAFHKIQVEPTIGLFEKDEGFVSQEALDEEPEEYGYLRDNGEVVICIN